MSMLLTALGAVIGVEMLLAGACYRKNGKIVWRSEQCYQFDPKVGYSVKPRLA